MFLHRILNLHPNCIFTAEDLAINMDSTSYVTHYGSYFFLTEASMCFELYNKITNVVILLQNTIYKLLSWKSLTLVLCPVHKGNHQQSGRFRYLKNPYRKHTIRMIAEKPLGRRCAETR